MTVKELRDKCRELGLYGYSNLNKEELENFLEMETRKVLQMSKEEFTNSLRKNVEVLEYGNDEDWHTLRAKRLGGSDIGAILGVNPWKSIIDVYIDKTQGSDFKGNEATHWGNMLENVVKKEFANRHKDELLTYEANYSVVDGYLIANVDGVLKDKATEKYGVLEIKTTNAFNSKEWEEETIPQSYYAQVQHYLSLTGYSFAYIAVLIGGNKYKEFKVERSEEDIALIQAKTKEFWEENITKEIPPSPDGSDAYMNYLKKRAMELENDEVIELDELEEKAEKVKKLAAQQKELKKQEDLLKEEILNEMIAQGTKKATAGNYKFNIQSSNRVDKKEFEKHYPDVVKNYNKLSEEFKKESRVLYIR